MERNEIREVPFKAWRLLPSFKPVEIELVEVAKTLGHIYYRNEKGGYFGAGSLFDSQEACIAHARQEIEKMEADIRKRQATVEKRKAAIALATSANLKEPQQ